MTATAVPPPKAAALFESCDPTQVAKGVPKADSRRFIGAGAHGAGEEQLY